MAETKTRPTGASVEAHIGAVASEAQRQDAETLIALMRKVTGQAPVMWGPSIIGFGTYHYRYASGHQGDAALTGFAFRKNEFALYISACLEGREHLLGQLGKHRATKGCLYIKRLADVDLKVLEQLVADSVADLQRRYPAGG